MTAKQLNNILGNRFRNIEEMAEFLGISLIKLKNMLNGTIPIPDWVIEKLGQKPPEPEQEPEPPKPMTPSFP